MNVREDLKAFVDHELEEARRAEIQEALDADESLREELGFMQLLGTEIRASVVETPVAGLDRTLRWLERAESKKRAKFPIWQLVLATVSCFVIAAIMFPVFAQSKAAAKKTAELSARKRAAIERAIKGDSTRSTSSDGEVDSDGAEANLTNGTEDVHADKAAMPKAPAVGGVAVPQATKERIHIGESGNDSYFNSAQLGPEGQPNPTSNVNSNPSIPNNWQRPLMIRTGELSLVVDDVQKSEQDATHLIEAMQGIVQSTNRTAIDEQSGTAEMTLRVPEARFMTAMESLSKLGKVTTQSSTGEDVTAQVADVEARLKVMRVEEDQYIDILHKAHHIEDILAVKERLSQVREEVESLDAQRKALRSQASYSTITLSMSEKPKAEKPKEVPENWMDNTLTSAKDLLSAVGRFLAQTAIYVGFLSPIWVPLLIAGLWWRKRMSR